MDLGALDATAIVAAQMKRRPVRPPRNHKLWAWHFSWDPIKAGQNAPEHGVSLEEAFIVFGDPLSLTVHDPEHSEDEQRFATIENSFRPRTLVVVHADETDWIQLIGPRPANNHALQPSARNVLMKKNEQVEAAPAEYDFTSAERGKYARRYAEGTNVVILDPDVAEKFKTSEEVNRALRELVSKRE